MQAYNIPSRAIEGRALGFGLKLDNQSSIVTKNNVPGPGAYNPDYNAKLDALPKYSMKGRHTAKKPEQRPAPGAYKYDFPDRNKAPSFGFGSSP